MTPLLPPSSAKIRRKRSPQRTLSADKIAQDSRRSPPDGGTPQSLPHRFQISQFSGATLASPEMQFANQRIHRLQFSVEESVQDQFPVRTSASRAHAGFRRRRRDHGNMQRVAEPEH